MFFCVSNALTGHWLITLINDHVVFVFFNLQVIEITEYRVQLYDYLKNRMTAIAPNLTVMVGELVGARLIAHAGACVLFYNPPGLLHTP